MTVYFIQGTGGCTVQAGTSNLRIIGVELTETSGFQSNGYFYIGVSGSSSTSGGSTQTPAPAKQGSPTSTASARTSGASVAGTFRMCGAYVVASGTVSSGAVTAVSVWKPMGDLILPPGGVFWQFGGAAQVVIWFEEFRLSWSY